MKKIFIIIFILALSLSFQNLKADNLWFEEEFFKDDILNSIQSHVNKMNELINEIEKEFDFVPQVFRKTDAILDSDIITLNTFEKGDKFIVEINVGDIPEENIKVEIKDGCLTVKAKKDVYKNEKSNKDGCYYSMQQKSISEFIKSYKLPPEVDADSAKIEFKKGNIIVKFHYKKTEVNDAAQI